MPLVPPTAPCTVRLRYFAVLRETLRLSSESWDIAPAETVETLTTRVAAKHGFTFNRVRVAVNGSFVEPTHILREGDEVAFIPPVCGG